MCAEGLSGAAFERTLIACFEEQVRRHGERPAVLAEDRSLTYLEVAARATQVARAIRQRIGIRPASVALLMDQGPDAIVAILGVLKAGCWWVPLDPQAETAELRRQVAWADAALVLVDDECDRAAAEAAPGLPRMSVGRVPAAPGTFAEIERGPGDLACLFFTSGSSGAPKAVADCSRNILHNVHRYTRQLGLMHDDRLSLVQPCAFSGTVSSLFGALLNGAAVCPYSMRKRGVSALASWLVDRRITVFHSVPAIFRGLLRRGAQYPDVRIVRLEGDRASVADLHLFQEHFGERATLAVGLGATETGLSRQWFAGRTTSWPSGILPLGGAVPEVAITLHDERGRQVPPGVPGEIHVHSPYLALGYWKDEARTRAAFSDDPDAPGWRVFRSGDRGRFGEDGCLEFLGRMDQRVKVRGVWVDLAETESVVAAAPGVQDAAAILAEGDEALTAFVTPRDGAVLETSIIRAYAAQRLPSAAVPARVVALEQLPRSRHAKLDRAALTAPRDVPQDDGYALEARVMRIWRASFGHGDIAPGSNFWDLGGDSVIAARICAGLAEEFGIELPDSAVVEHPTAAGLARRVEVALPNASGSPLFELRAGGGAPLLIVPGHLANPLSYRHLADALPGGGAVLALRPGPRRSAQEVLGILRARHPEGPYHLMGHCRGAAFALELAHGLVTSGARVGMVALLQAAPADAPALFPSAWVHRSRLRQGVQRMRMFLQKLRRAPPRIRLSLLRDAVSRRPRSRDPYAPEPTNPTARPPAVFAIDLYLSADDAKDAERSRFAAGASARLAKLRVHEIAFADGRILAPEHAAPLASMLADAMRGAETMSSLSSTRIRVDRAVSPTGC